MKIPEALGHFAPFHLKKARMHPMPGKRTFSQNFRLGDLAFMMREDQVFSTSVQVNLVSKVGLGHD